MAKVRWYKMDDFYHPKQDYPLGSFIHGWSIDDRGWPTSNATLRLSEISMKELDERLKENARVREICRNADAYMNAQHFLERLEYALSKPQSYDGDTLNIRFPPSRVHQAKEIVSLADDQIKAMVAQRLLH